MKVLIVCSGNAENFDLEKDQAFIYDQIHSIGKLNRDIQFDVFPLKGKGIRGYLGQLKVYKNMLRNVQPDIVHAHGGHVGFLCILQRSIPVLITFHGSDINKTLNRYISWLAACFSAAVIYVSKGLREKMPEVGVENNILACGVDRSLFFPMNRVEAKKLLGLDPNQKYILFASSFTNEVKNYPLARAVVNHFPEYSLLEISNRKREEVNLLINGAELVLLTSFSEGSPQIIKEALACNQKIVSVNVGDVAEQLKGIETALVCESNEADLVNGIKKVLNMAPSTTGRLASERYDSVKIASKIADIYFQIKQKYENPIGGNS